MHGRRKYIQREPTSEVAIRTKAEYNDILKAREEDPTNGFKIQDIVFNQESDKRPEVELDKNKPMNPT